MDENAKLVLDLTRNQSHVPEREPVAYDVKSLLEEGRRRVYTAEGQKLIDAAREGKIQKKS